MGRRQCYLNQIYTDENDNSLYYELVFSDSRFQEIEIKSVEMSDLMMLSKDKDLIKDFTIEDGFLKCNNDVNRVVYHNIVNVNSTMKCFDDKVFSLYSLFELGVNNGFYVIDDEVAEHDEWMGNGIVSFRNIKFSQSTMSVYVKMVIDNRLYHKHLIKVDKNTVLMMDFMFLVPKEYSNSVPASTFVKDIVVNNVEYGVYRCTCKQVLEKVNKIVPPLINKACLKSVRIRSAIKLLKAYQSSLLESMGAKSEKLEWIGGEQRNVAVDTINFETSAKVLNKEDDTLRYLVFDLCKGVQSMEEAKERIYESNGTPEFKFAAMHVMLVILNSNTEVEALNNVNEMRHNLEVEQFYCDVFAYKIRMFAFLTNRSIVSPVRPIFYGSELNGFTLVKKGISDDGE